MRRLIKHCVNGRWYAVQRIVVPGPDGEKTVEEKSFPLGVAGRENERRAERALRDLDVRLAREAPAPSPSRRRNRSVGEAVEEFLRLRQGSVRASTHGIYRLWLGRFAEDYGALLLSHVRATHAAEYRERLLRDGYAKASINIALRSLRSFGAWCVRTELMAKNPLGQIEQLQVRRETARRLMTWHEFEDRLLPVVANQRLRTALALMIYAGLRRGEVCALQWRHVDLAAGLIRVHNTAEFQTKSGRHREVPIHPALRRELDARERVSPYVAGASRARPDPSVLSHDYHDALVRAWPDASDRPAPRLHDLRGSFATELLRQFPPAVVREILGHADIQTTMRYYAAIGSTAAADSVREGWKTAR